MIVVGASIPSVAQDHAVGSDPFQLHVGRIELSEQSAIDGIAVLSRRANLRVAVEFPLGVSIARPAPTLRLFNATIEAGTVAQMLDKLCSLDATFTWFRLGNVLHVLPRAVAQDPNYVFNRRVDDLSFQGVNEASDAVMKMVDQLPGPREQLAVMQVGVSLNFSQPWKARLRNMTVREVVDQIAQQVGRSYGWQLSGAQDFRIVVFQEGLLEKPGHGGQKEQH